MPKHAKLRSRDLLVRNSPRCGSPSSREPENFPQSSRAWPLLNDKPEDLKKSKKLRRSAPQDQAREKWRVMAVAKDDRDILDLLKDELDFIEKGGYGRSVRTPWKPTSTFQDSLTCINFGDPSHSRPCNECLLIDFVAPELRDTSVPCHQIPLNDGGETIEDLELQDNQLKLESTVREWLKSQIERIEKERAAQTEI